MSDINVFDASIKLSVFYKKDYILIVLKNVEIQVT